MDMKHRLLYCDHCNYNNNRYEQYTKYCVLIFNCLQSAVHNMFVHSYVRNYQMKNR